MLPMTSRRNGLSAEGQAVPTGSAFPAVRLVVHALAALVLHDVALGVELREVERVEQEPHAVGFEPQRRLEVVRRHDLEIRGAVVRRRAVVAAADALGELVVQPVRHVARPGEHDVLEQVREPRAAGQLVLGPDVVPEVDRHGRRRAVGGQNDRQAVRKRVAFERNPDRVGPGGSRRGRTLGGSHAGERHERNPRELAAGGVGTAGSSP